MLSQTRIGSLLPFASMGGNRPSVLALEESSVRSVLRSPGSVNWGPDYEGEAEVPPILPTQLSNPLPATEGDVSVGLPPKGTPRMSFMSFTSGMVSGDPRP